MDFLFYNNTIIYVLIALICAFLLIRDSVKNGGNSIYLNVQGAVDLVNKTHAVFIDVRPADAFKEAHIPQAKNIPLEDFKKSPQKLPKKPLILVGDGKRALLAGLASQMNKEMPHRGVYILEGGLDAWRKAQYPLKTPATLVEVSDEEKGGSKKTAKKRKEAVKNAPKAATVENNAATPLENTQSAPISSNMDAEAPTVSPSKQESTMPKITVYIKPTCPYCIKALGLLESKGVENMEVLDIAAKPELKSEMVALADGRTTVPQIFIGDVHVGGCDDLHAMEAEGKLDTLLGK